MGRAGDARTEVLMQEKCSKPRQLTPNLHGFYVT